MEARPAPESRSDQPFEMMAWTPLLWTASTTVRESSSGSETTIWTRCRQHFSDIEGEGRTDPKPM